MTPATGSTLPALPPERLGQYTVVRSLTPQASYLCHDERGQQVVLKRLEDDCLLRGQLHPSIKERLHRVRELAQKQVATLHTVERIDDAAWLVWEFAPGQTLVDSIADDVRSDAQLSLLAREVILSVESLHAQGIIHGAMHWRNVIIDPAGNIRLTHISPLLYSDPAEDARAVVQMLSEVINQCGLEKGTLCELIAQAQNETFTLRQLAARLVAVAEPQTPLQDHVDPTTESRARRRALIGAAIAALCGIVIAVAAYAAFSSRSQPPPGNFEPLDNTAAR
jgi:tRNA A-37 threonylcarbamoyl transferase component Bud32